MLTQHLILKQKISHFLRSFFFSLLIFSVIILHSFHPLCLSRLWCISDMQINYGKMKKKKKLSKNRESRQILTEQCLFRCTQPVTPINTDLSTTGTINNLLKPYGKVNTTRGPWTTVLASAIAYFSCKLNESLLAFQGSTLKEEMYIVNLTTRSSVHVGFHKL